MTKNKKLWRNVVFEDRPKLKDSNLKFFATEYLDCNYFQSFFMNNCPEVTDFGFRYISPGNKNKKNKKIKKIKK